MGKNNRQRRAAKQRTKRRGSAGSARPSGRTHPFHPESSQNRLRNHSAFTRAEAGPSTEQMHRQQAERSLQRLLRFRGSERLHSQLVEHELIGLQPDSLQLMDELITGRLFLLIASLWEHGWQPLDALHVVRTRRPRSVPLIASVIMEQARRANAERRASRAWLDQVHAVAEEGIELDLPRPDHERWLLVETMMTAGFRLLDAWTEIVILTCYLTDLPRLEQIAPPPSAWETPLRNSVPSTHDSARHKLLNRIRALLAKAEATSYAAEAETFTAKAQDLMTRHAIDEALLRDTDEQVAVIALRVHLQSPYASMKATLLNAVSRANRCKVIYNASLAIATVVGVPVDVDQVEMLFTSLLIQATRAMAEAGAARPGTFDRSATFRRSFLTAYAVRIGERLIEADAAATESYGKDLVPLLQRQEDAVQQEFDRLFPHIKMTGEGYYDRRGWEAGRRAADRAAFTAGRITA
jgi:uncharacterized protein DUF2786